MAIQRIIFFNRKGCNMHFDFYLTLNLICCPLNLWLCYCETNDMKWINWLGFWAGLLGVIMAIIRLIPYF